MANDYAEYMSKFMGNLTKNDYKLGRKIFSKYLQWSEVKNAEPKIEPLIELSEPVLEGFL